jgi:hypothetical protein
VRGECGVAGGGAEHDDASGEGCGDRQADVERGVTHRFQDQVDPARQMGDLGGQIGASAVQDLVGAERFDDVVLGR